MVDYFQGIFSLQLFFSFSGLKFLIIIPCVAVTFWQCVVLIQNYSSKETLRKISKIDLEETLTTMIVVCRDPPLDDSEQDIISQYFGHNWSTEKFSIIRMKTLFKVHLLILPIMKDLR